MSLEIYLNGYKEDLKNIFENYKIDWDDDKIKDNVGLLFDVCTFTIPATFNEGFQDKDIAEYYTEVFMETERSEKNKLKDYEYFQNIMNEHKMNIFGLFPFLLAIENRPYFEGLLADNKLAEISARAISFTNDLVMGFCENNPVLEGYIGDYVTQKTFVEKARNTAENETNSLDNNLHEQSFIHCPNCGVKNRISRYNRRLVAKCGKCGHLLESV